MPVKTKRSDRQNKTRKKIAKLKRVKSVTGKTKQSVLAEVNLSFADERCQENLLEVRVGRAHCQALVDSGAHISVISETFLAKVSQETCETHLSKIWKGYLCVCVCRGGGNHTP